MSFIIIKFYTKVDAHFLFNFFYMLKPSFVGNVCV